jgi:hypothetical protein
VGFAFIALIFGAALVFMIRAIRSRRTLTSLVQVEQFAAANGLRFDLQDPKGGYAGGPWDDGQTWRLDHFQSTDGRVDYGTVGKTGKYKAVNPLEISYLAIRLDRMLPHIVLRRGRGARSGFGIVGDGPKFELEGDFGRHFSMWVPEGYERDALYIFTPDLMALLIDEARGLTAEIVDDCLYFYSPPLDPTRPDVHVRMRRIANTVGAKAGTQTEFYRDERVERDPQTSLAPNRVATSGRRLPKTIWVPGVILALAVATSPFWGVIAQAIADAVAGR